MLLSGVTCFGILSAISDVFFRHLKPGGYIEHAEQSVIPKSDDGTTDGTVYDEWGKCFLEAGDRWGKTFQVIDEGRSKLIETGFKDVTTHKFKCPIGGWPKDPLLKEIGRFNRVDIEEGMEGYVMMLFTKYLGVIDTLRLPNLQEKRLIPHLVGTTAG